MSTLSMKLPESLHEQVQELGRREGVSINQFVVLPVAEKMSALMTEDYLEERARQGNRSRFERVLAKVKDIAPDQQDEM